MKSETGNIIMIIADCHHNFLQRGSSHRRSLTVPVNSKFQHSGRTRAWAEPGLLQENLGREWKGDKVGIY